jgi:hypothetical protein
MLQIQIDRKYLGEKKLSKSRIIRLFACDFDFFVGRL